MERKSTTERRVVTFNPSVEVLKMCVWNYAYWNARKGNWTQFGRDRDRFQRRIQQIEQKISYILDECHRLKILEKLTCKNKIVDKIEKTFKI